MNTTVTNNATTTSAPPAQMVKHELYQTYIDTKNRQWMIVREYYHQLDDTDPAGLTLALVGSQSFIHFTSMDEFHKSISEKRLRLIVNGRIVN